MILLPAAAKLSAGTPSHHRFTVLLAVQDAMTALCTGRHGARDYQRSQAAWLLVDERTKKRSSDGG